MKKIPSDTTEEKEHEMNAALFQYLSTVVANLFAFHKGDPIQVLASINTSLLMVLSAMHNGNQEMVARHVEEIFPHLAENIRASIVTQDVRLH